MTKVFHYKNEDFVTSHALKRYRDDNNLTNLELTKKIGLADKYWGTVATWCSKGRVPLPVLEALGIKRRKARSVVVPAGGTLYVCYVGAADAERFRKIADAFGIEVKSVL